MKRAAVGATALVAVLALWIAARTRISFADAHAPVKAGDESLEAAEIIGEGVISTPDDEFGGTPAPDGKTLYFDKTVPPHYMYVICESKLVNGNWSKPEVVPFSGEYRDSDPVLSPDGQTLYFASDRPAAPKAPDERRFRIWQVRRVRNEWSKPMLVPGAINSQGSQVFASVTNDGTMYFTTSRKSGYYDVFRVRLVNGEYKEAEDLGASVNVPGVSSLEAWVAPDESYLLIGSFGRAGGYGNSDIFASFSEGGVWSKPVNLGPSVNTPAREYSPRVTVDGKWLYFASEKGFPYDKREQPVVFQQFEAGMASVRNGLGNIYRIPWEPLLNAARQEAKAESQGK